MSLVVPVKKRILIYGPPKSWKTGGIATIPKGASLWLLDVDRQLGEFAQEWNKRGHSEKNVTIVPIDTKSSDAATVFNSLRDKLWNAPPGYDFYAIDCYSTVGLFITYKVIGKGENRHYNQQNNTELAACVTDWWMEISAKVERWGSWLITTMHEQWIDVDDGTVDPSDWRNKKRMISPAVASGAKVVIPGQHDLVWHVEKDRGIVKEGGKARSMNVAKVRTEGTALIMASSSGKSHLLNRLEPYDISLLMKKMGEDWKRAPKKVASFQAKKKPSTKKKGRFVK